MSTGPGLPVRAMWNASTMMRGRSFTSFTRKLCLVMGRVTPQMSASWKASLPMTAVLTWPVMQTIGMPSMFAVARPVTVFVAPGPEVTRQQPTSPVAREKASAMCAAPCSWRGSTTFMEELASSWKTSRMAPPG